MKNFILPLFFLFTINSFSQTKHEDGPYKEYHENGQLRKEGFYKNDNKISVWKDYYEDGQLKRVYTFNSDGQSSGIEELYSKKGTLISEKKRSQNGGLISKQYFENGKLSVIYALVPSENNKYFIKAGGYKEYYENDTLKIESLYINNELSGIWKQYYETGEIEWEVEYLDGYKQGFYKQFYKNGLLKLEGLHVADLKNGEEKRYDEKGSLLWKGNYFKNDFDDTWTQYDSIGNSINVLSYNKGKLKKANSEIDLKVTEIPDGVFEQVPVYPGCEIFPGNKNKRDCMSKNVQQFVNSRFNTKVLSGTNITGKMSIHVIFKIDKTGKVTDIRARAQHPNLEKEAINVVSKLPVMKPGMQKGKAVTVPYSLPIVFVIKKDSKVFQDNSPYHYGHLETN